MPHSDQNPSILAEGSKPDLIDFWHEAMSQLRQLHADVWNGVKFFSAVNSILIVAMVALARGELSARVTMIIIVLSVIGVAVTLVGRRILRHHRDYYLEMLLRKTMIEIRLGFYDQSLMGFALSFPWSIKAENLDEMQRDPRAWVLRQRRRRGTISRLLFFTYEAAIVAYLTVIIIAIAALLTARS